MRVLIVAAIGVTLIGCGRKDEPAGAATPPASAKPYELTLIEEKEPFESPDQVLIALDVKDLGVRKMVAPELYWGLALVWDGVAYNLKPRYKGIWNGPMMDIIPNTSWRTGVCVIKYTVPAKALAPGEHIMFVRDDFAESNQITVVIAGKPGGR